MKEWDTEHAECLWHRESALSRVKTTEVENIRTDNNDIVLVDPRNTPSAID